MGGEGRRGARPRRVLINEPFSDAWTVIAASCECRFAYVIVSERESGVCGIGNRWRAVEGRARFPRARLGRHDRARAGTLSFVSWNHIAAWLETIEALRGVGEFRNGYSQPSHRAARASDRFSSRAGRAHNSPPRQLPAGAPRPLRTSADPMARRRTAGSRRRVRAPARR
jgi:hypothetical protein